MTGAAAEAGEVDEEEEEEECTSLLMGEITPELPNMAGEMSFLPKLSKLLETLLILRGAFFELELVGNKKKHLVHFNL